MYSTHTRHTHTQLSLQPQLCLLAIAQHACARTLGRMGAWARGGVGGRLHTGSRGHGVTDGRTDRSDTARAGSDRLVTSANYVVLRGSRSEYFTEVIGPRLEFGDPVSALQLYDSSMYPATVPARQETGLTHREPRESVNTSTALGRSSGCSVQRARGCMASRTLTKRERDPICDVCGHNHVQGVKCDICGHVGKYIGERPSR